MYSGMLCVGSQQHDSRLYTELKTVCKRISAYNAENSVQLIRQQRCGHQQVSKVDAQATHTNDSQFEKHDVGIITCHKQGYNHS